MKKKSVYFIYIVPHYHKNHLITIECPKRKENKNEILWGIEYNVLKTKRQLIKNLNVINLELKKKEEIRFKFKFTKQDKIYESKYIKQFNSLFFFISFKLSFIKSYSISLLNEKILFIISFVNIKY